MHVIVISGNEQLQSKVPEQTWETYSSGDYTSFSEVSSADIHLICFAVGSFRPSSLIEGLTLMSELRTCTDSKILSYFSSLLGRQ